MNSIPSYRIIRSRRRTMALELSREGELLVRLPYGVPDGEAARFVRQHADWIARAMERQETRRRAHPEPTPEEAEALKKRAHEILPGKVAKYAARMGVTPTGIRITSARTRFGSCSAKNSLSFSWRLMDYPEEAIDYVVVHELAHIRHHNHSKAFYAFIERYLPDYRQRAALLRQ